jgi:hypothetical protein
MMTIIPISTSAAAAVSNGITNGAISSGFAAIFPPRSLNRQIQLDINKPR